MRCFPLTHCVIVLVKIHPQIYNISLFMKTLRMEARGLRGPIIYYQRHSMYYSSVRILAEIMIL